MKKILLALAAGATTLAALPAQAEMDPFWKAQNPYVGIGIANSDRQTHMPGAVSPTGEGWKSSAKAFVGVQFDETFGAEFGYTDFRENTLTYTISTVPGRVTSKADAWYLAGKATAPISEQFSIYGKLGVTRTKWQQNGLGSGANLNRDERKTEGYGAIGAEWRVSDRVGLALEYERYGTSKGFGPKPNVWSLNANYRF